MLPETLVSRGVREENASKSSLTCRVTKQGHLLLTAFVGQRHVGLAVLALATVFALRTVASVKTANKSGTAATIETFDTKWRCPVRKASRPWSGGIACEFAVIVRQGHSRSSACRDFDQNARPVAMHSRLYNNQNTARRSLNRVAHLRILP